MFWRGKPAARRWAAARRRELERERERIEKEILACERELAAAPELVRRELEALERRRAEEAGFLRAAPLLGGSRLPDIRPGRTGEGAVPLHPPGWTRARVRHARMMALLRFVILAGILAVCLIMAASMSGR